MISVVAINNPNAPLYTVQQLVSFNANPPLQVGFRALDGRLYPLNQQDVGVTVAQAAQAGYADGVRANMVGGCACVIYQVQVASPTPNQTYVYHAAGGILTNNNIADALTEIGTHAANVLVVYAHWGGPAGYAQYLALLQANGVPANNIIEVTNLPMGFFAFDTGRLGF